MPQVTNPLYPTYSDMPTIDSDTLAQIGGKATPAAATPGGFDPSKSISAQGGATTAPAGTTDDGGAAVQATLATQAAAHGGMPQAPPVPQTAKNPVTGVPDPTGSGVLVYTFPDGVTAEVYPNGGLGTITPVTKTQPTIPTPAQVMAQAGQIDLGNGNIYEKNPTPEDGRGPYVPSVQTQNQTQITQAKQVADTNLATAQAAAAAAKTKLDNDPTNVAAQQAKTVADTALAQAQATAQTASAAASNATAARTTALTPAEVAAQNAAAASSSATAARTTALTPAELALTTAQADKAAADAKAAADPTNIALKQAADQAAITLSSAQAAAQTANAQATTRKANEPTVWQTGTTAPTTTFYNPATGRVEDRANPSYLPADPGHMIQQLQQQAQAQQQTLQQQVASGKLTPDQAAQQFDQWYGTNVEPFKGQIAAAQTAQQQAIQKGQADIGYTQAQTANIPAQLANTASDQAQRNIISQMPYLANANAPALMQQAVPGGGGKFNPQALMQAATYSLPNLQEVGRLGAAQALANFSPTAQMHLQTPGPPGQLLVGGMPDLNTLIGQNQFTFGQPPPPAAPPPAAAPPAATAQIPQNPVYPGLAQGAGPWGTYQPGWQPGQPVAPNGGW